MSSMSDYLESGILDHILRGNTFAKPSNVSIALTSDVPLDSHTGSTINEVGSGIGGVDSGYTRYNLYNPATSGDTAWDQPPSVTGSGNTANSFLVTFPTALVAWGYVSGVALVDDNQYGSGNMLMHAPLLTPRDVLIGDNFKFNTGSLDVLFK